MRKKSNGDQLIALTRRDIEELITQVVRATIVALDNSRALPTARGRKERLVNSGCITADEAADLLGYSENSIRELIEQGRLPYTEVIIRPTAGTPKHTRRIPRQAVLDFAAKHLVVADNSR